MIKICSHPSIWYKTALLSGSLGVPAIACCFNNSGRCSRAWWGSVLSWWQEDWTKVSFLAPGSEVESCWHHFLHSLSAFLSIQESGLHWVPSEGTDATVLLQLWSICLLSSRRYRVIKPSHPSIAKKRQVATESSSLHCRPNIANPWHLHTYDAHRHILHCF